MSIKRIQILSEAEADLEDGRLFYEIQEQGVGEYFWDSLLSDIESLIIYAGVHIKEFGYYPNSLLNSIFSGESSSFIIALSSKIKSKIATDSFSSSGTIISSSFKVIMY